MPEQVDEPVHVVDYDSRWPALTRALAEELRQVLPAGVAIEHIGSTAVPGLAAKPVLDLLVGVTDDSQRKEAVAALVAVGWTHLGEASVPGRDYLRRRVEPADANVHIVQYESGLWNDNLALREYLRRDAVARERYAEAKRDAVREAPTLLAYSARKAAVVARLVAEAHDA